MNIFKNRAAIAKSVKSRSAAVLRAAIETLESRTMLTSVVVNSISDTATGAGVVTLRDAIAIANSSATPTTITFSPTVFAKPQTIVLDGTQLELSSTKESTTIDGPSEGVTISANGKSRVIALGAGCTADLANLTITGGSTSSAAPQENNGGGIEVFQTSPTSAPTTLTLRDSTVSGNSAPDFGGGINVHYGTATLIDDSFFYNKAQTHGGGGSGLSHLG